MKTFKIFFAKYALLAFAAAVPSLATVIDFEAQAANRGGNLTGIPDLPLTIGAAAFTGGELLVGDIGLSADATSVYASEGLFGSGETNPVVITFAAPVQDFSVFLANGEDSRSYTVADNVGDSVTNSLASVGAFGAATFSLPDSRLTKVTITSANTNGWNFAIDNVTFTPAAASPVPEPESMLLMSAGLLVVIAVRRR